MLFHPVTLLFFPLLLLGIADISIAILVLFQKRDETGLIFALWSICAGLWAVFVSLMNLGFGPSVSLFGFKFAACAGAPIPYLFLLLSDVFPDKKFDRSPILISLLFFPAMAFLLVSPTGLWLNAYNDNISSIVINVLPIWAFFYLVYFIAYLVFGLLGFYHKYIGFVGQKKQQVIYLLFGLFLTFMFGIFCTILPVFFGIGKLLYFGPFGTIFFIAFTCYAIVRHRLMDIEFVIKRSFVYSVLTALIAGIYSLIIFIPQVFFGDIIIFRWVFAIIGSGLIAISFKPLENAFTEFTDKYFFKAKYDYHKTLKDLSRAMAELTSLERLTKLTTRLVMKNVKIEGAMLFVYDYNKNLFHAIAAQGNMKEFKDHELLKTDDLVRFMDEKKDLLLRDDITFALEKNKMLDSQKTFLKSILKQMNAHKAVLAVPSKIGNKLMGFILLSEKKSQDAYSTEDLILFETLAPQAAIAIKNAMTYDEIKKDLEARERKLNETEINLSRSERIASMARLIQEYNHEIRTPLGILSAKLSSLPDNPADITNLQEIKDFFMKQINRASDIIDTTLRLSQPKEHKEELLDLNSVIEESLKLYQPIGVNLVKELTPLPQIKGDFDDLKLVFINLLKNAKEAIPDKGEIRLKTFIDDQNGVKMVVASVSDTGIGIPKENFNKIFEPFFSTHTTKGRGLGLSLVFRIVREHSGMIDVDSKVGKGSTFFIKIPVG